MRKMLCHIRAEVNAISTDIFVAPGGGAVEEWRRKVAETLDGPADRAGAGVLQTKCTSPYVHSTRANTHKYTHIFL